MPESGRITFSHPPHAQRVTRQNGGKAKLQKNTSLKLFPPLSQLTDTARVPGAREVRSRPSFRMPGRRPAWPRSVGNACVPSSKPVPVLGPGGETNSVEHCLRGETGGSGTLRGARSRTLNRSLAMELRPPGGETCLVSRQATPARHTGNSTADPGRVKTRIPCRKAGPGLSHGVLSRAPLPQRRERRPASQAVSTGLIEGSRLEA